VVSQTGELDRAQSSAARHSTQVCETGSQLSGASHGEVVQSVVGGTGAAGGAPLSVLATSPGWSGVTSSAKGRCFPQLSSTQATAMAARDHAGFAERAWLCLLDVRCCPTRTLISPAARMNHQHGFRHSLWTLKPAGLAAPVSLTGQ
jgi:hypothetical protein